MLRIILLVFIGIGVTKAQSPLKALLSSTLLNKNVYKTKANLTATIVYKDKNRMHGGTEAPKEVVIKPGTGNFLRYKELKQEGDFAYIRVIPSCALKDDTIFVSDAEDANADDYILKVNIKGIDPAKRYLSSSVLVGKIITLPIRVRQEYYNENKTQYALSFSIGYAFGWRYKIGNHPYKTHYFTVMPYAFGFSTQKYFYVKGKDDISGKTILSDKTDQVALNYLSMGIAYEYDRFNVGVFWGKDMMFGDYKDWVFQDKPWYGIGLGYDLFK